MRQCRTVGLAADAPCACVCMCVCQCVLQGEKDGVEVKVLVEGRNEDGKKQSGIKKTIGGQVVRGWRYRLSERLAQGWLWWRSGRKK